MKTDVKPPSDRSPDAYPHECTVLSPVTLAVSDLQRCADFYNRMIGLTELRRSRREVILGIGGQPLLNLRQAIVSPAGYRATGLYHIAFLLPSRPALAQKLRQLIAAGVRIAGAADHGVSEALYMADPEGNGIEMYYDRPAELWPFYQGHLAMGTDRLDIDGLLAESPAGADSGSLSINTRIGHLHLRVADLTASEDFYRNILKMNLMQRFGQSAAFLSYGGYHHHIGLNTWESLGAPRNPAGAPGLVQFRIRPPSQAIYDSIKIAAAATISDGELQLRDPTGNCVVVTAVE